MELYNTLGKGIVSIFIGLTNLFSPAQPPVQEQVTISSTKAPEIKTPVASTTVSISTTTKQKTIPIYLNYPEKVSISPIKTIDQNFRKVFLYSIEIPQVTTKIPVPIVKLPEIQVSSPIVVSNDHKVKNSIVNIFCSIRTGRTTKVVTGSGVIIDPRGIILTNAHVGQFPLLEGSSIANNMDCSVRTGSPVNNTHGVKTLFISRDWVNKNYRNISQTNFTETGENDIAILQIENAAGKTFDYLPLSFNIPTIGDSISIASYPADSLTSRGINALLTVQIEQLRVSDSFSFINSSLADLLETSDSLQAQHGSSGGALLSDSKALSGIIVVTVGGNSPLLNRARALTISHVNNVILKDTGKTLNSLLSQDINSIVAQFETTRSDLIQKLIDGSAGLFF